MNLALRFFGGLAAFSLATVLVPLIFGGIGVALYHILSPLVENTLRWLGPLLNQ